MAGASFTTKKFELNRDLEIFLPSDGPFFLLPSNIVRVYELFRCLEVLGF